VRIALDTNVLVSAVATRGLCADVFNLVLAEHELIIGETVLAELKRVLRQKMRVPAEAVQEFEALLRQEGLVVGKTKALSVAIRDKSDVPVLSEAVAGNAEVLVTGDRDLLDIVSTLPLKILTPRGLWEQLRKDAPPDQ
jgi:putative PIN family toxin of toxin-antitoxin system